MTKEGIMIIGHGSKLVFNKDTMHLQADRLRDMGYENIYIGYNETTYPLVDRMLETMVEDGIDTVYAVPLFIASGMHLTRDIPRKLGIPENSDGGIAEVNGKKVTIKYATPIGRDPYIAKILAEKIEELR